MGQMFARKTVIPRLTVALEYIQADFQRRQRAMIAKAENVQLLRQSLFAQPLTRCALGLKPRAAQQRLGKGLESRARLPVLVMRAF